jgi:hypothetical protein
MEQMYQVVRFWRDEDGAITFGGGCRAAHPIDEAKPFEFTLQQVERVFDAFAATSPNELKHMAFFPIAMEQNGQQ